MGKKCWLHAWHAAVLRPLGWMLASHSPLGVPRGPGWDASPTLMALRSPCPFPRGLRVPGQQAKFAKASWGGHPGASKHATMEDSREAFATRRPTPAPTPAETISENQSSARPQPVSRHVRKTLAAQHHVPGSLFPCEASRMGQSTLQPMQTSQHNPPTMSPALCPAIPKPPPAVDMSSTVFVSQMNAAATRFLPRMCQNISSARLKCPDQGQP